MAGAIHKSGGLAGWLTDCRGRAGTQLRMALAVRSFVRTRNVGGSECPP